MPPTGARRSVSIWACIRVRWSPDTHRAGKGGGAFRVETSIAHGVSDFLSCEQFLSTAFRASLICVRARMRGGGVRGECTLPALGGDAWRLFASECLAHQMELQAVTLGGCRPPPAVPLADAERADPLVCP